MKCFYSSYTYIKWRCAKFTPLSPWWNMVYIFIVFNCQLLMYFTIHIKYMRVCAGVCMRVEARCFVYIIIFIQLPSEQIDAEHKGKRWFKKKKKNDQMMMMTMMKKTTVVRCINNAVRSEMKKTFDCGNQVKIAHQHHSNYKAEEKLKK